MNDHTDDLEIILKNSNQPTKPVNDVEIILDIKVYDQMTAYAKTDLKNELAGVMLGDYQEKSRVMVQAAIEAQSAIGKRSTVTITSWATNNQHLFPIGKIDLDQAEPEIEIGDQASDEDMDIEIDLALKSAEAQDDIDIKFN